MREKNISEDRKKYLGKIKKEKISVILTQILIVVIFIVGWEILANKGIIDSFITSQPSRILDTFLNLSSNGLLEHLGVTLTETLIGFILGVVLGVFIAILLWWSRFLSRVSEPFLVVLNSLPKVALGPILIIWVGAGMQSIIVMALLISTIITIINVYQGFTNIDPIKIKLMKTFKATKSQIYFKLILPGTLSNIISCFKVNISMSLIGVIMGEFLVSKEGIGYLIMYGSQVFNLDLVITGTIILCIVAVIMYGLVLYLEKKLIVNK